MATVDLSGIVDVVSDVGNGGAAAGRLRVSAPKTTSCELNHLPCKIQYDGHAPVGAYFQRTAKPDSVNSGEIIEEATFRGRYLLGKRAKLPSNTIGLVLRPRVTGTRRDDDENEGGAWDVDGTFEELTYWNRDTTPLRTDPVPAALRWTELARAIHRPVDMES